MNFNNKYYVYLHIKEDTGKPFYVGKGNGNRSESKHNRSKYWQNVVNKHGFDVILLEENLIESDAFEKEIYWINRIGRKDLGKGSLINFTNGGEGLSGKIVSKETRNKMSLAWNNRIPHTQESKDKMSAAHKGQIPWNKGKKCVHTQESKDKMSLNAKNRKLTEFEIIEIFNSNQTPKLIKNNFNISLSTISKIKNGVRYSNITNKK